MSKFIQKFGTVMAVWCFTLTAIFAGIALTFGTVRVRATDIETETETSTPVQVNARGLLNPSYTTIPTTKTMLKAAKTDVPCHWEWIEFRDDNNNYVDYDGEDVWSDGEHIYVT